MKKILIALSISVTGFAVVIPMLPLDMEKEVSGRKVYCAPSFDPADIKKGNAPLLKGLGNLHYSVSTKSKKAQKYFDQGLALTYGFNHGEAGRSFNTAIQFDSTCAMAYWGLALVLGPNYNAALNPTSLEEINEAIDNAVKFSANAKANEKALIHAMRKRFPLKEVKDMTPYYEAYAAAMRDAYRQFPNDITIATLLADALMNIHPWNLWLKDGTPQPWTKEIIDLLEETLRKSPDHPGAMHYYIHAIEASKNAGKATPFADKLRNAMPSAGHLVHMPSHIYIRTGEYHKGVIANEKASEADSTYIAQCKVQGAYPVMYYPHNIHFLAACAFLEGSSAKAIDAAWMVSRKADRIMLPENVSVQHFYSIPYFVLVHFGKWDDILNLPAPEEGLLYPKAIWHYARGMAFAAKSQFGRANDELDQIKKIATDEKLKGQLLWEMNPVTDIIGIASNTLEGELNAYAGKYHDAIEFFKKAIVLEDGLNYIEPPDWFFSVRLSMGHWMNKAGRYTEAEAAYRQDLELFPENGWALAGLFNSLTAQKRSSEAAEIRKRLDKAWSHADISINSSRIL